MIPNTNLIECNEGVRRGVVRRKFEVFFTYDINLRICYNLRIRRTARRNECGGMSGEGSGDGGHGAKYTD